MTDGKGEVHMFDSAEGTAILNQKLRAHRLEGSADPPDVPLPEMSSQVV